SLLTSCSRIGRYPRALLLLGYYLVKLATQVGLYRSIGRDALDGVLKLAAVVAQLVACERREGMRRGLRLACGWHRRSSLGSARLADHVPRGWTAEGRATRGSSNAGTECLAFVVIERLPAKHICHLANPQRREPAHARHHGPGPDRIAS